LREVLAELGEAHLDLLAGEGPLDQEGAAVGQAGEPLGSRDDPLDLDDERVGEGGVDGRALGIIGTC
jgi:hypothetical protein